LRPKPTVKNKLSSMSVGTKVLSVLLKLLVKAVTVAVSLKVGNGGMIGLFDEQFLAAQGDDLYSRMAVVVVLSNGAFCALW